MIQDNRSQWNQYICKDISSHDIITVISNLILYLFVIDNITDHNTVLVTADSIYLHILMCRIDCTRIQVCTC